MITQLSGTLLDKGLDSVVVDVGGVGYLVHVSLSTLSALPAVGQPVRLMTHLQVREDAFTLYGFATLDERRAFELCLSVSGVGPKLTLAALSGLGATGLGDTIAGGDVGRLQRVPGIGKKTAERLVMELRDKFKAQAQKVGMGPGKAEGGKRGLASGAGPFSDVVSALTNLGYKPPDAERAVDKVLSSLGEGVTPPIEEVLRQSLRALQKD